MAFKITPINEANRKEIIQASYICDRYEIRNDYSLLLALAKKSTTFIDITKFDVIEIEQIEL